MHNKLDYKMESNSVPKNYNRNRKFTSVIQKLGVALTLAMLFSMASGNIFTSSIKVERMVLEEEQLLDAFKDYIDAQYDKLKRFSNFYSDRLKQLRLREDSDAQKELSHPNAAYHSIKTFASQYSDVLGDHLSTFIETLHSSFLADAEDIRGARMSLLRLQAVYNMKAIDMIKGDYLGFQGPPLSYVDAYEIGQTAFTEGKLKESLEWLNASLQLLSKTEFDMLPPAYDGLVTEGGIKALIGRVHMFNGEAHLAEAMYQEAKLLDPLNGDTTALGGELTTQPRIDPPVDVDYFANFSRLCSLEKGHHPAKPNSPENICRYRRTGIPYYVFKEEILSTSPFASVMYDVISDAEGDHFKEEVKNKLERGKIGGDKAVISDIRTSDLAWIWDTESDIANNVARRVERITGLDCTQRGPNGPHSSEAFQVVNYGLGGHYEVHMDPLDFPSDMMKFSGERIGTFLIYLSDVERGGATVFTHVGVSVAPKKNMALLWYNFDPALDMDEQTVHGGCPVLIGHKWITNKWISTYANLFKRRCPLDPNATQLDIEQDMLDQYGPRN